MNGSRGSSCPRKTYVLCKGVKPALLCFLLDGECIKAGDTPLTLKKLKDGDQIDCVRIEYTTIKVKDQTGKETPPSAGASAETLLEPALVAAGWESAQVDANSGKMHYFGQSTNERSWEKPILLKNLVGEANNDEEQQQLPDGWKSANDSNSGKLCYYHTSGKTSGEKPPLTTIHAHKPARKGGQAAQTREKAVAFSETTETSQRLTSKRNTNAIVDQREALLRNISPIVDFESGIPSSISLTQNDCKNLLTALGVV